MDISTTPEANTKINTKVNETITPTFTNKISVDEYNTQKDEYTQKALKELGEQMKTFEKPKKSKSTLSIINTSKKVNTKFIDNKSNDNDDDNVNDDDDNDNDNDDNDNDDNDSESDYENKQDTIKNTKKSTPAFNLIVQHVENTQKKRKVNNTQCKNQSSMSDTIYAQHELDIQTIHLLKDKMNELKIENSDLDSKKHYLTLDLNNVECDNRDLKKQIKILKEQNIKQLSFIKQMKKHDDDFTIVLKYFCAIIGIIFIYVLNNYFIK